MPPRPVYSSCDGLLRLCSHVRLCSELGYGKGGVSAAKVVPFVLPSAVTAHLVRQPSGSVYYSDVGDRPESENHSGSNVRSHAHNTDFGECSHRERHIHSPRQTSQWMWYLFARAGAVHFQAAARAGGREPVAKGQEVWGRSPPRRQRLPRGH